MCIEDPPEIHAADVFKRPVPPPLPVVHRPVDRGTQSEPPHVPVKPSEKPKTSESGMSFVPV